jgi:hypothetical protein
MVKALVPLVIAESVDWNVTGYAPAVVGVPVIAPLAARPNPGGRAPPTTEYVYGGTPPKELSCAEYGTVGWPSGRLGLVITTPPGYGGKATTWLLLELA